MLRLPLPPRLPPSPQAPVSQNRPCLSRESTLRGASSLQKPKLQSWPARNYQTAAPRRTQESADIQAPRNRQHSCSRDSTKAPHKNEDPARATAAPHIRPPPPLSSPMDGGWPPHNPPPAPPRSRSSA